MAGWQSRTYVSPGKNLALTLLLLVASLCWPPPAAAQDNQVTAHVFWQKGCPYCTRAKDALREIAKGSDSVLIDEIELGVDPRNDALFSQMLSLLQIREVAVPFTVIGERYIVGFSVAGQTANAYRDLIERCQKSACIDLTSEARRLSELASGRAPEGRSAPPTAANGLPAPVSVPWLGEIPIADLSLPVLTVVLAGIDGFNPCAMWVLVLLIGLLIGVADSRRMWTLGLVFLAATGAMYFAVMSAWLNIVLWLNAVIWLRMAIGALAVGAGIYYLREYWTNPEAMCRISAGGRQGRFSSAFRRAVEHPNLAVAIVSIAALAVVVNLVELACSAGVPAVYTQFLAMHDLPQTGYYAYLALYLLVFLLDDTVIFIVAMVTLRETGLTARFTNTAHLIGGAVLLALGWVMLLRPEWLG